MLYLKLKEEMEHVGIKSPHRFLIKFFGYRKTKAYNLVNNKTRTINLDDLSEICQLLDCTPNDLLYWKSNNKNELPEQHALATQLSEPPSKLSWNEVQVNLNLKDRSKLREYAEQLLLENKKK